MTRHAEARSLEQLIPHLFGGSLATSISPLSSGKDAQRPLVADRFRTLSASLATARAQLPVPSATGAFRFEFDDEADSFVRREQSLGPSIAERAQTLGARTGAVSVSYTRIDFNTLEGDSLDNLRSSQPALSADFLATLPNEDERFRASDNILDARLRLKFGFDLIFLTAAYGVSDNIDVSLALSLGHARMSGDALAMIRDPRGDQGAYFIESQPGVVIGGKSPCAADFTCAADSFDRGAFGTGDIYLRGKWHIGDYRFADLAVAGILTVPTGNADDYLGFHDPTFTPWLIASKSIGRFAPHVNLGYGFRSGADVSQAEWIAGSDVMITQWLTLAGDFLGYHDDKRDGINDDILQSAVGFKINPFGQFVLSGSFQFPLNRDGLRADVIYTTQLEYTF